MGCTHLAQMTQQRVVGSGHVVAYHVVLHNRSTCYYLHVMSSYMFAPRRLHAPLPPLPPPPPLPLPLISYEHLYTMWWITRRVPIHYVGDDVASTYTLCGARRGQHRYTCPSMEPLAPSHAAAATAVIL